MSLAKRVVFVGRNDTNSFKRVRAPGNGYISPTGKVSR